MATKKATKKTSADKLVPTADQNVKHETLREFGKRNMTDYAIETNLGRSVPDVYDGCKPVHRRILFAASHQEKRFIKTARVVGDVLGKYHPHGDKSIADAIETLVNMPTPTIKGSGNWGSLTDGAAAMRYTEMKLSGYGLTFFDQDYINKEVTPYVPNFDDSEMEPVALPAMLPNVLLNGGEGIGVGISTLMPTFTAESVIGVLKRLLGGEKLESTDYAKALKFAHRYGGRIVNSAENKRGWQLMFDTSKGRVQFESEIEVDRDSKSMRIADWPVGTNTKSLIKFVDKIRAMPETQRCYNSKGTAIFSIECKPAYNFAQFDKFVEKVRVATRKRCSFKLHVTKRNATTVDGVTKFETDFLALSVPALIRTWLKMRVALELRSLEYRTNKQNAAIAHSKLLIYACDHLESGVKALRSKDPKATLCKLMKIDEEQAQTLLNLKFIQWSKLDQEALKVKLKEQEKFLKQLQTWTAKPRAKILADLTDIENIVIKDRQAEQKEKEEKFEIV